MTPCREKAELKRGLFEVLIKPDAPSIPAMSWSLVGLNLVRRHLTRSPENGDEDEKCPVNRPAVLLVEIRLSEISDD